MVLQLLIKGIAEHLDLFFLLLLISLVFIASSVLYNIAIYSNLKHYLYTCIISSRNKQVKVNKLCTKFLLTIILFGMSKLLKHKLRKTFFSLNLLWMKQVIQCQHMIYIYIRSFEWWLKR